MRHNTARAHKLIMPSTTIATTRVTRVYTRVFACVAFPFRKVAFHPPEPTGRGATLWGYSRAAVTGCEHAYVVLADAALSISPQTRDDTPGESTCGSLGCVLNGGLSCFSGRLSELTGLHRRGRGRGRRRRRTGRRRPEPMYLVREVLPRHRTVSAIKLTIHRRDFTRALPCPLPPQFFRPRSAHAVSGPRGCERLSA